MSANYGERGSGYVDYSQPGAVPDFGQTEAPTPGTYNRAASMGVASSVDLFSRDYSDSSRPTAIRNVNLWGKNGYFMNGPSVDPFSRAETLSNQIKAYTYSWTDPAKEQSIRDFTSLVTNYGSTNSPGALWAIAASGYDVSNPTMQQVLAVDARATAEEYGRSQPVQASAPAATEDASWVDNIWQPLETASRNVFAALSMPMEAVQGAIRGIGGELTDETAPWTDFENGRLTGALAQVGSLVFPPIAMWADRVRGDNDFINPWEQTEFGQTMLTASAGAGMEAFSKLQAGLDVERARTELLLLPENNDLMGSPEGVAQLDAMSVNYARDMGYYGEPGWFIDETSPIGESQRQATFDAWAIPGKDGDLTAWTLGRGIFSNIGGPDWTGYSVASGLVDAVAAIALDPTIIAGKFGIPSKTIRGATGLVRGADEAVLIGKERRVAQNLQTEAMGNLTRRQINLAMGEYEKSRRAAADELRVQLGREPNVIEIENVVGKRPTVNPTDLARMETEELATMTRDSMIADLTDEAMKQAKVDEGLVANSMRDVRRAAATETRAASIMDNELVTQDAKQIRTLWDGYLANAFTQNAEGAFEYDPQGFFRFTEKFFGYNKATDEMSPEGYENAALLDTLFRDQARIVLDSATPADPKKSYEAAVDFGNRIGDLYGRKVKRPVKDIPVEQVNADAARIYTDPNIGSIFNDLMDLDITGASLAGVPARDVPVASIVDGVQSVAYWAGKANPIVVEAVEVIPSASRTRLKNALLEILEQPNMRIMDEVDETESVAGQIAAKYNAYSDPRQFFAAFMDTPNLSWGDFAKTVSTLGLDGYADDIMRALPRKARVDGVTGMSGTPGRGTWMGNHPSLNVYEVPSSVSEAAQGIRGADDIDAALAGLVLPETDQVLLGMRGQSVSNLDQIRSSSAASRAKTYDDLVSSRADRIMAGSRQETALRLAVDDLTTQFADPEKALKATIGWHAGLRTSRVNGITLNEEGVRAFLFGTGPASFLGNKALDALSDFIPESDRLKAVAAGIDSPEYKSLQGKAMGQLFLITRNQWGSDVYRQVADNAIQGGGKAGLVDILSPRLGIDVKKGSISRTTTAMNSDGKSYFRSWRRPSPVVARALGQMPTPRKISIQNTDEVTDAVYLYGQYAKLDETWLAGKIGEALSADGSFESVGTNRNVLLAVFNEIGVKLVNDIEESGVAAKLFSSVKGEQKKKAIIQGIQSSTRLYLGGMTDEASDLLKKYATDSAIPRYIDSNGNSIEMPGIQLDTELANGFIGLPSVDEWRSALSRFTLAMDRSEMVSGIADHSRKFFDNFFRTSLLAFRVSYVIRNLAEMQVRMFLNGHKSMLSDPMTLAGMTIGNIQQAKARKKWKEVYDATAEKMFIESGVKPKRKEVEAIVGNRPTGPLRQLFAPYADTVLGTAFEVGTDEALAAANHVEEYFALIRQAHSLTDPRVYNSAVRQGWQQIGYGTPGFNDGWAHELIMLQRSRVARLVVDDDDLQFIGTGVRLSPEDRKIQQLMFSPEFEDTRALLVGADSKFKDLLSDKEAVRQYLFTSPNSIFNRVMKYTGRDPRLIEYLKSGRVRYGADQTLSVREITDSNKRIQALSTVLKNHFNGKQDDGIDWAQHFVETGAKVSWVENMDKSQGIKFFNKFFDWANKIERIGAVGPEFRMAYWDRIAELAPGLRAKDVDRALKSARTTLGPLKRMMPDGQLDAFGPNHPAWKALDKAKKQNSNALMTLDEIHGLASAHAAEVVSGLFYDAAKRNNTWNALRLVFPFGQAWGNTVSMWTKLGAKQPIQIYKAQKAFNAMTETGSSAVYEFGSDVGAYGQYAPGFAPWDQDTNGGFFYTDQYGSSSFMAPFVGRAAALPLNAYASLFGEGGTGLSEIPIQSPTSSLNLALGADSIFPGIGPIAALPLATGVLPDNEVTASIRQIAAPFGEKNVVESMVPAWFAKIIGGVGALPVAGDIIGPWLDVLAPANKNKNLRDAMMILSTSGNYPGWATDPEVGRRLRDDAQGLGKALLMTTGLIQNVLPSTPVPQPTVLLKGDEFGGELESENTALYTVGLMNSLFQLYRPRNGYDDTAAREEFVKDFGPAALFATTGDWKNLSRIPTSQALQFARKNPDIANAYVEEFPLFFPNGDASDVLAISWIRKYGTGDRLRKTKDEIYDEAVSFLERIQRARINSMEANELIDGDEATAARDDLNERYIQTGEVTGKYINKSDEMERLYAFVDRYDVIKSTDAGTAFMKAWVVRQEALLAARELTGRDDATLGAQDTAVIRQWYTMKIDEIQSQHVDFLLLANKFRKEWD